ncbi:restriction endonuclease subunit S [Acinetobacter thermotolerans]|uniref:restriction endonuclease subunit S n=1 Tax=Acinetobacter thermotolerans TaxID=3151487 RepID=UPI00325BCF38
MFNKYDAYKDSGVDWLDKIPTNWSCIKMKFLYSDISIKGREKAELLSVTQDRGVIPRTWVENRMVMPSGNLESFKYIQKGDFAISLRSFEGGLEYCYHDGIISPAYTVLKKKRDDLKEGYYKYLFKSKIFISELQTSIVGIREGKNISYEELRYSYLPIPTEVEQNKISCFLDQKTAEIDQAIAIKEQQIALLNERKQIVIQKAVTQGLNPNVATKDSGVEWIGQIPEHWDLLKLKNLALVNPTNTTLVNSLDKKASVCFLAMESVETNGTVDYSHTRELASVRSGFTSFVKGDVLVAKITPCFENGKGAYLDTLQTPIGFGSTEFHVLRVKKNCDPKFLYYVTKSHSFMDMGEGLMIGSAGQKRVPTSFMQNYLVAIPDMETQIEIVNFIDQRLGEIAEAIDLQKKQIEKLKEYKTTLINDAVTGKIKVA